MAKRLSAVGVLAVMVVGLMALAVVAAESGTGMTGTTGTTGTAGKTGMAMEQKPTGEQVTMVGRLACTSCTLAHPDKPCEKGCCEACMKAGDPASLIDKDGNIYLLLSGEMKTQLMTPERMAMAGSQVTVKGLLVKAKGITAIYVDSIEKAQQQS